MNKSQQRNSSIELLRIISMVMIVFHHFAVHGGFEWEASNVSIPLFWYNFIIMGGKIGVDVFVLISGYFLVNSKGNAINFRRILKFWGQVFFYSITIYVIFGISGISDLGIEHLFYAFFPITFSAWGFASTYFVLYLFHPVLNKLLHCLDKRNYQSLLVLLVVCWSIIPTFTSSLFQSNSLLWFMTLYAIAGYARFYGFNSKFKSKHYWWMWFLSSIFTYATSVALTLLGTKWSILAIFARYYYGQEKLPVLLASVSLFMAFATMKMNYHKWINVIASATFGVYLIHDNLIIRTFIWIDLFENAKYQESTMIIPYSIIVVAIVYVVCTAIDLVRQKLLEKTFLTFVDKYSDSLAKTSNKIIDVCKAIAFGRDNRE